MGIANRQRVMPVGHGAKTAEQARHLLSSSSVKQLGQLLLSNGSEVCYHDVSTSHANRVSCATATCTEHARSGVQVCSLREGLRLKLASAQSDVITIAPIQENK